MIRLLVDADLPSSTVSVLQRLGFEATDVRDIGLGEAPDSEIALYAKQHGVCILTGDFGFGDVRNYPPEQYQGLVVLEFPNRSLVSDILKLVEIFFGNSELVARLPGRLAIVNRQRVRFRPA
jgi:predicted nuclease of predicted toxin-antitoxin system